jgi:MerR family transcriptional regulator, light-induced transcriptional regulator
VPEQRDTDRSRWQAVLPGLQRTYADAVLGGSESAAEGVVSEAIQAGVPEPVISGEVIAPTMRAIGDLWERGLLSVADEHLATEISIRVLALQREAFRATSRRGAHRVVLAGVEGERHGLGLTMAGSVLVHAGYDVRMLGPDLPMSDLASAVDRHQPSVVGLSVTQAGLAALVPEAIDEARRIAPRVGVVVGGSAASEALTAHPGVRVCRHVADAVELTEGLVQRAPLN